MIFVLLLPMTNKLTKNTFNHFNPS